MERIGERRDRRRSREERGVAEHFGERAGPCRDDGNSRAHRLQWRMAEAFVERRVREHARAGEEIGAGGVVDVAESDDAVAVARGLYGVQERGGAPAVGAGNHQAELGVAAASMSNAATSRGRFLRGSTVPRASTYRSAPARAPPGRGVTVARGRDPGVDAHDAVGGTGEEVLEVDADGVAVDVDRRAACRNAVRRRPANRRDAGDTRWGSRRNATS